MKSAGRSRVVKGVASAVALATLAALVTIHAITATLASPSRSWPWGIAAAGAASFTAWAAIVAWRLWRGTLPSSARLRTPLALLVAICGAATGSSLIAAAWWPAAAGGSGLLLAFVSANYMRQAADTNVADHR